MVDCKNCSSVIRENFCANCGQPAKIKRIDRHYILHELQHLLHLEKGFLYTVKELFVRPGNTIREYMYGDRGRHMKPVPFLVFTSLLYTLIAHYFHIEEEVIRNYAPTGQNPLPQAALKPSTVFVIIQWMQEHYGYTNMIAGGVIALWLKWFFRRYDYNIFEINMLLCFVIGEGMLLAAAGALTAGLVHSVFLYKIVTAGSLVYISWAIGQFFHPQKPASYIKAFLAYVLGLISFGVLGALTGVAIDMVKILIHKA
jgi:hypothetical protein